MSGWDLEPERVRGVLRSVETQRTELDEVLRRTRVSALVLGDHIHWFEVDRLLHVVWTRTSEPVSWIAAATDQFLQGVGEVFGVPRWAYVDGDEWRGSERELEQLVLARAARNDDGSLRNGGGYPQAFLSSGDPVSVELNIEAGDPSVGRRVPVHSVSLWPRPLRGTHLTAAMVDQLCEVAVRAWQPARAEFSSAKVRELYGAKNSWAINPAWRLWLSDEVGPIDQITDGVTATRTHGGSMLAVPDELTPEQVVETMAPTLRANNLTEIPH